jgi:hypothetical protein
MFRVTPASSLNRAWILSTEIETSVISQSVTEYDVTRPAGTNVGGFPACVLIDNRVAPPGGPLYISAPSGSFSFDIVPPALLPINETTIVNVTYGEILWFGSNSSNYPLVVYLNKIYYPESVAFNIHQLRAAPNGCVSTRKPVGGTLSNSAKTVLSCPDECAQTLCDLSVLI